MKSLAPVLLLAAAAPAASVVVSQGLAPGPAPPRPPPAALVSPWLSESAAALRAAAALWPEVGSAAVRGAGSRVIVHLGARPVLAWRFELNSGDPDDWWLVLIDAHQGETLLVRRFGNDPVGRPAAPSREPTPPEADLELAAIPRGRGAARARKRD